MLPAALNAFGTCSSSATIPISKQRMEDEMGVSNKITSITIPLGATVNMDAVSILMSFMIMFFANACGINVSISMMIIILLANVLLSVGTPGIPGGAIASFAALATMAACQQVLWVFISVSIHVDVQLRTSEHRSMYSYESESMSSSYVSIHPMSPTTSAIVYA
mgnify:CR=1 FL=1